MKKLLYIPMVLAISVFFVACGVKAPIATKNTTTKTPITAKATTGTPDKVKITYTKELKYIPSYTGLKLVKYTAATKKAAFSTAKYTIKNTTNTKVYQNYQAILKKDGWTIYQAEKSSIISAKKGKHMASIVIDTLGKDITIMIISK